MTEICKYFKMKEVDVHKMLAALDVNQNGRIEYNHFLAAALDKKNLLTDENIRGAFNLLDTQNQGYIEKQNITGILGAHEEAI